MRLENLTPPPNVSTATESGQSTRNFPGGSQRTGSSMKPPPNVSAASAVSRVSQFATGLPPPPTASPGPSNTPRTHPTTSNSDSPGPSTKKLSAEALAGTKTWKKMKPLSPLEVVVRPLPSDVLPKPEENGLLFFGEEKLWYLGFVGRWAGFQSLVMDFYNSQLFRSACDEIKGHPIIPPRSSDLLDGSHGSQQLADFFQREVLEVVVGIYNKLLETMTLQQLTVPDSVSLGQATDEDLGNEDLAWNPKFVVRAMPKEGDDQTRLIGHAEYLGGRPGALSWAIQEQVKNSWGSLRCVLGDIAQWMLMDNIRYAFLTCSDEVIFIKFDIVERVKYVNRARGNEAADVDQVDVLTEPWLYYSDPIKFTDVLNEAEGKVPVRLALLSLLHIASTTEWHLPANIGSARK
ncbi:uncharacterized protein K460DRAFT_36977 [Cucurbitaria berberidis CBS 394.84]|uniref:Uncharacterized protein n=1 Tax=Cucurbitaria berberidis CBS 394.84 TaxID=1168544 RepID=A0A9P4GU51_9PLEO|nr:uncharacterized protein K460DRAFT_36977 [Cucurbitaria berberidis CBS 394.84]KAF1851549.1 hypothetical protein K460DRAFT_36977 [Cucurbitaria berberidis CBS 394.84]